jgi:NAD(P)-dependent dehydrogenase (short-subunit alcohol dehydrogenase family)
VAILFAREGADVTVVYLPEEEEDARDTKKMVEDEGRQCLLIAGNLMDNKTCEDSVKQHVEK